MSTLILTRKVGQEVMIGRNVVVRVVSFRGTQIQLEITAPREITVDRREVRDRKEMEKGFDPGEVQ